MTFIYVDSTMNIEPSSFKYIPFDPWFLNEMKDWNRNHIIEKHQKSYRNEQNVQNHFSGIRKFCFVILIVLVLKPNQSH